jgi:tetratricopeptide (TPR) repeat protein
MEENWAQFLRGLILIGLSVAGVLGFVIWTLKKSAEPGTIAAKWLLSLPVFALILVSILWLGPLGPFVIVFCAIILSFVWTPHLGAALASPLTSLFDGGNVEPEPQPFYSIARARQKQGRYTEAVSLIREQLSKFPRDLEGQLLLAQIQAEDLKDLPAAELTIERFLAQPGHAPKNICFALYSLADWHLKCGEDREGAVRALQRVQELLPGTEFSASAAQRLAHLTDEELPLPKGRIFAVPEGSKTLGLERARTARSLPDESPEAAAARYVAHLEQHPLDHEARENLARLYGEHYQRWDWAQEQLEFLIRQPHQPPKLIAKWLNLVADLQLRSGKPEEAVQETLQRIVDLVPGSAAADLARNRLALLRLELKGKQKSQAVKLGSYEQNLGLKGRLPDKL